MIDGIRTGSFTPAGATDNFKSFSCELTLNPIRIPTSPILLNSESWFERNSFKNNFASGFGVRHLPAHPTYQQFFDELLIQYADDKSHEIYEDIQEIIRNNPNNTEREVLIKARVGQGKFRSDMVKIWGHKERCVLTGIDIPELLTASHIRPWRDSSNEERLDPANGLLLVTHADKLFDKHLLSFENINGELRCVLHPRVTETARKLGITPNNSLKTTYLGLGNERRLSSYLKEHFQKYVENLEKKQ